MLSLFSFFIILTFTCTTKGGTVDHSIIEGTRANIKNFPYQGSLREHGRHICGAVVINKLFLLTAAHCLRTKTKYLTVHTSTALIYRGGEMHFVCQFKVHEEYNKTTFINDIALLKVCEPMTFSPVLAPVNLTKTTPKTKTECTVSGWGYRNDHSINFSILLKEVNVPIVDRELCQKLYHHHTITLNMLCAGVVGIGRKDPCQGDSGGPLVSKGKLVGIVSWGNGCVKSMFPGVYTNVANFINWINSSMK